MDEQVDALFNKMIRLLQMMQQTGATRPANEKIAIELMKYERELYIHLRDYGSVLRQFLALDRNVAGDGLHRQEELYRLRQQIEDDLDGELASIPSMTTSEMPSPINSRPQVNPPRAATPPPPAPQAPPPQAPTRPPVTPGPPPTTEPIARTRSASEILSQLNVDPGPG